MSKREIDDFTGVETTGHEWDGIKELDNPMPRWWLWTFYICIAYSIGYVIYYPAIPLVSSVTQGISGITTRQLVEEELQAVQQAKSVISNKIETASFDEIRNDETLNRFSIAGGKSTFKVYCTQCHGSGAQGGPGYPNLNDDDWLWGGDIEAIYTSIKHGIRTDDDEDARVSEMPGFGADEILEPAAIKAISHTVLSMAGLDHDAASAKQGVALYQENCADCHGEKGKGDIEQGAPNLTDAIWFYGNTADKIIAQINCPTPWRHACLG